MESIQKQNIHFILPSGGPKGCFQAGFLYRLMNKYKQFFSVYQADGVSIGALNGLGLLSDDNNILKDIWSSIQSQNDIFEPLSRFPLFNNSISYLYSFSNMSVFDNSNLVNIVNKIKLNESDIEKFNCTVVNLEEGIYTYINGTDKHLSDYVIASASPWILSPPMKIDEHYYTDGALLHAYPTKYINQSKADLIILVGYDKSYINKNGSIGDNIFTYLSRIIDISIYDNLQKNIEELNKCIENKNVIVIDNPMDINIINFTQEQLSDGFKLGSIAADDFAEKYFLKIS